MTLEEEITVDLMIEEIIEMAIAVIDSAEETDLDPALQETIEVQQDKATTMTSEEDQERDPDPVAEMDLHTVENGIVMTTDILSEEACLTTEPEAQIENRAAEDQTMTEEASFQIPSHTARDLPTEEKEGEAVADMTTMTDGQWEVKETDSKEDLKVDRMASNTAPLGRESTTVTASTAIKRVTSLSTAPLLEEREEEAANMVDTAAAAAVAAEATMTIGKIEEIKIEEVKIEEAKIEEVKTVEDKTEEDKTTLTVSESVEKLPYITSLLINRNTAFKV